MTDRYGQAIGGIKSQQRIMRADIAKLRFEVLLIRWSLLWFYGTLITAFLARHYGWW